MAFHKLQGVDGFIVSDFAGTPRGGVLRVGPKILQSSSDTLARWATYTFATAGIEWSGAAVGVNADGDGQEAALAAALDELTSAEHPPLLLPWLPAVNRYPTLCPVAPEDVAAATTASVVAAAAWALGGSLDGATVAIESPPAKPAPEGLADGFTAAGAQVTDPDPVDLWPAPVDCLVIGSKPGLLSHESAERVTASVIVPWGPVPLTTRALAILHRNSTTYVPDFLSAGGGLLLLAQSAGADVDPVLRLLQARDELGPPSTDGLLFLRAAERAEAFLRTWQQDTPFGRPLV